MENFKKLENCLCCESKRLFTILDLNKQPLANSYHKEGESLEDFPLALNLCLSCGHTQLSVAVNPDFMFKNYLYVSGTTKTLREYFEWFAKYVHTKHSDAVIGGNVLDIACNDGSQLVEFGRLGYKTYGVDPAENLAERSRDKGINLTVGYWNDEVSKTLPEMSIITAQNVFAHNSDPYGFLLACKNVMDDDSVLFIQTSQANMFDNNEFDTIYHEHISFFCINSMFEICRRAGLYIDDVIKPPIHGTSYVFTIKKGAARPLKNLANVMYMDESKRDIVYFDKWSSNAKKVVAELKSEIEKFKSNGYTVVGYGAAAKGNTLLNFGDIKLDYIVDDNELKHGLLTPGMNIEIKSPSILVSEEKLVIVPLAWNFFAEIKKKVCSIRESKPTSFILYFPKLEVFES